MAKAQDHTYGNNINAVLFEKLIHAAYKHPSWMRKELETILSSCRHVAKDPGRSIHFIRKNNEIIEQATKAHYLFKELADKCPERDSFEDNVIRRCMFFINNKAMFDEAICVELVRVRLMADVQSLAGKRVTTENFVDVILDHFKIEEHTDQVNEVLKKHSFVYWLEGNKNATNSK